MYVNNAAYGVWKYAEFDPEGKQNGFSDPNHYELFNLTADPYELYNVYDEVSDRLKKYLHDTVHTYYACRGSPLDGFGNGCP